MAAGTLCSQYIKNINAELKFSIHSHKLDVKVHNMENESSILYHEGPPNIYLIFKLYNSIFRFIFTLLSKVIHTLCIASPVDRRHTEELATEETDEVD